MNENGPNTIRLNIDAIPGLFWTKTMALVGLGNGFDNELGLGLYL